MRPLRIFLEDFMSHRSTDIDCTEFKSALIVGKNRNNPLESNGVGKTTIFKAIEYALFGVAPTKLDRIVRDGCERCRVIFEFESSGEQYRIVRSRNRKTSKSDIRLFRKNNNDWIDYTQKTASETEAELAKIIKISHIAFQNSIHFAQSDLSGLASATPKDRKAMLRQPLQMMIYSKFEELAKDKAKNLLKEIDSYKTLIKDIGDPKLDIDSYESEIKSYSGQIIIDRATQIDLQKLLELKQNELAESKVFNSNDLESVKENLSQIKNNIDKYIVFENEINYNLTKYKEILIKLNEEQFTLNKTITWLLSTQKQLLDKTMRPLEIVQADKEKLYKKEIEGSGHVVKFEAEKQRLDKKLPDGEFCNHCQQIVSQEHRESFDIKRKTDLLQVEKNIDNFKSILLKIKAKRTEVEKELVDLQHHNQVVNNHNNNITNKQLELKHVKENITRYEDLIKNKEKELPDIEKIINEFALEQAKLQKIIDEKNDLVIKQKIIQIQSEHDELVKNNNKITEKLFTLNDFKIRAETQLSFRISDLDKLVKLKDSLFLNEKQYSLQLKAVQAFGSNGIPTLIINTILDDLQITANNLLATMRPGIELCFLIAKNKSDGQQEDTLDIIYRVNGMEREYEQLSGGQKLLVALSLKLGMSLIIQHRIGVDIKFLELDEVDQSLDAAAVSAFADVIKIWQDKFTILVVTHNESLKDKFSHAIVIEADGQNGSTGKLVTSW